MSGDDVETVTILSDSTEIREQIDNFITEYNTALKFLNDKLSVDPETNKRGGLAGDFTFLKLKINLRTIISSPVSSITSGNPALLSEIGITTQSDGRLEISDEDTLENAIADNAQAVIDLFDGSDGIATNLTGFLNDFTLTGATIDDRISIIEDQK